MFFIVLRGYILWTMARNCHLEGVQKWNKGSRRVFRSKLLKSYIPWNVLLSHLNGERTMSERWVNGERTLNERWANAEWTMSERWMQVGERYVNAERWANASAYQSSFLKKTRLIFRILKVYIIDISMVQPQKLAKNIVR